MEKVIPISDVSNEALLDALIYRYMRYEEYVKRDDCICWTPEAEYEAYHKFAEVRQEILKRMEGEEG